MVHGGVGGHAQLQNASGVDAGALAQIGNDGIQGFLHNGILQLLLAAGTTLLNDAVDHICAIADLTVAGRTLGQNFAAEKISKNHGHGGGADVDGAADNGAVVRAAYFHTMEDAAIQPALDANAPVVFPQRAGQLDHDGEGDMYFFHTQRILGRPNKTLDVGHGVVQGGFGHGNNRSAEGIGKFNAAGFQLRLAFFENSHFLRTGKVGGFHTALISGSNIRNKDGAVAGDFAVAAQTPAGVKLFLRNVAAGEGVQLTINQLHTTLAAGAVTGAGGIDGHIGPSCQFQQIVADLGFDHHGGSAFDLECNLRHGKNLAFLAFYWIIA